MKNFKLIKDPYLIFSPFLILFVVIVLKDRTNIMEGDAIRYVNFAKNLLHGFYSLPEPNINLWNGPGYPIILMPFIALRLPLICITLLNAIFQYLSIVLLFKAMLQFFDYRKALIFSLFWASCYSTYNSMPTIMTESFSAFLISLLIFLLIKAFNIRAKNKYFYLSGFILGYIALTKVIFGYVLLILFFGNVLMLIKNMNCQNYRRTALIMLIAFLTTMPYLLYTYNLTGRIFYWGNSGGSSLYWMSTPYKYEYGAWEDERFIANRIDFHNSGKFSLLKLNHQKDIIEVKKYRGVQKDDAYKKIAINNITSHPKKYINNVFANISRALFGFPANYTFQRPLLKIWYFAILYALMVFCFLPTIINWRRIPFSIRFLLLFVFIYLIGSSLISFYNRMFFIIVPILWLWIAYIINKSLTIKIKFDTVD